MIIFVHVVECVLALWTPKGVLTVEVVVDMHVNTYVQVYTRASVVFFAAALFMQ